MKNPRVIIAAFTVVLIVGLVVVYNKNSSPPKEVDFFSDSQTRMNVTAIPENKPQLTLQNFKYEFPKSNPIPPRSKEEIALSEQYKKEFLKVAKIFVPYPKDFVFKEIDIDPNMLAITGFKTKNATNLTLIVRRGPVTPQDVLPFLKENANLLPNVPAEVLEKFPAADPLDINPKNGLVDNTLWEFKFENRKYWFLFATRKDKKGSYLAIFTGPTYGADIDSPEIYKMADEIKAVD